MNMQHLCVKEEEEEGVRTGERRGGGEGEGKKEG